MDLKADEILDEICISNSLNKSYLSLITLGEYLIPNNSLRNNYVVVEFQIFTEMQLRNNHINSFLFFVLISHLNLTQTDRTTQMYMIKFCYKVFIPYQETVNSCKFCSCFKTLCFLIQSYSYSAFSCGSVSYQNFVKFRLKYYSKSFLCL